MTVFRGIKKDYESCCRRECKDDRGNAKLKFSNYRKKIILKIDEHLQEIKMVDFFVYIKDDNIIVVILEIKGPRFDDDDIKSKFDNGSAECENIFEKYLSEIKISGVYPIFLVPSVKSRFEWERLKGHIIKFGGKNFKLIRETGVIELSEVIRKWG